MLSFGMALPSSPTPCFALWLLLLSVSGVLPSGAKATESTTNTTCPQDVFRRVQGCIKHYGILAAALKSIVNHDDIPSICGPEQNETLTCLQHNLDLCADNPSRLALLKLQVDPQRVHSNMSYFCANQHVLKVEENCTNYHEVSTCTERVASKLWNSLVLTKQFKPVLDTQCLYNDDLEQCFTGSMGDNCERTRQLYLSLLAGMRFPYCDLNELEQHVKLHEALALPEHSQRDAGSGAGGSPGTTLENNKGSGVNSVFMSGGVWAPVGLLWLLWLNGV